VRFEFVEDLLELGQMLCAIVAGGCGHAEALAELREVLFELGQALCATVAGGCGQAEALEELFEVLFELVEDLREVGEVLRLDGGHTNDQMLTGPEGNRAPEASESRQKRARTPPGSDPHSPPDDPSARSRKP
jgi:hypothetical protein